MAKLPRVTARQIIAVLLRCGFVLSRQDGSHQIYKNALGKRTTVPVHASKILHPKILKTILKDADISVEVFRKLLS